MKKMKKDKDERRTGTTSKELARAYNIASMNVILISLLTTTTLVHKDSA